MKKIIFITLLFCFSAGVNAQETASVTGIVTEDGIPKAGLTVYLEYTELETITDEEGRFVIDGVAPGYHTLIVSTFDFNEFAQSFEITNEKSISVHLELSEMVAIHEDESFLLDDVVISGTMKPVRKLDSPVPVEVYSQTFFKKSGSPTIFDGLQNINGVRPQVNCNVCNTGDIHINGLEGPYTMVMIDGMPIMSSLGTVYGFSGIPNSLIERVEIVKGPASSLYGSEAVGGLINIITKNPGNAPIVSADISGTSWEEFNADVAFKFNAGEKADVLTGINYFNFQKRVDKNGDNFTDKTLQDRISIFQKWNFNRKNNRLFSIAGRYLYEDRWGGEMNWNKSYRGGDEVYGESIYTNRFELIGKYQLPAAEKMFFDFSLINHDQDSRYGDEPYIANQKVVFGQFTWDKQLNRHDLLFGAALKHIYYDDNTPATATVDGKNAPEKTWLPGIFVQDEINLDTDYKLLLGVRYDYHNEHGSIFTPRLAYKWTIDKNNIFRLNAGTGFRVVNLFSEEHAALTGGKEVVILNNLKPEKSYNVNLNFIKKLYFENGSILTLDATAFYTYFTNQIIPDYETKPTQIIYDNLDGHAVSKGIGLNVDLHLMNGWSFILGATLMENTKTEEKITQRQFLTERFTGTWTISYRIRSLDLTLDYTGNLYSPMRLPLISDLDPRQPESPWYSIQNIQLTYSGFKNFEIYGGVKNLLNFLPTKGNPFLISRSFDPFDNHVQFDGNGDPVVVPVPTGQTYNPNNPSDPSLNPWGLIFDPDTYVYASMQGIHAFFGVRYNLF